ncbi:ABC transporter substrate-binding protein [Actinoplanes sp. NPDC051851]|uniref:ABC transporter substrate-binding protein n=1 Tax=Actinoplanes sp. NPDC051851 TaxID=3154753 RepID=UPI003428633B
MTRLAGAAALAASLTVTAACGGTNTAGTGAATSKTLTMALQGQILNFDPWGSPNGLNGSVWSMGAVYDSLTHVASDGTVQPWLATSWTQADSTHLTLQLRDDVKFSDGTAFDGSVVKANLDYAQSVEQPGECNAYVKGVTTAVDSATQVTLTLATPNPDILTDLGTCAGFMVSPTALGDATTLKTTPSGSGPYTLATEGTVQGQTWTFTRNASYWAKDTYKYDKLVMKFFSDTTAAANAAKSGQVDVIQSVDAKTDTSGQTLLLSNPQEFRGFFFDDVTGDVNKALGDVRVRQALNYALDRDTLVKAVFGDTAVANYSSSPFVDGITGFTSALNSYYSYDPAKAKQLLADAGYASGLTIKVLNYPGLSGQLAQAVAGQLREVGVNLDISDHGNDFLTQLATGDWPIVTGNYTLSTAQYHNLQGMITANGFFNARKNTNADFDKLLDQIAATTDAAQQKTLYEQLATTIAEQAWFLVPAVVKSATAYNDKKVTMAATKGSAVPFLYNIQPAS